MPDRHGPLKTGLGRFVATVNPGGIGGGAVAVGGDSAFGDEPPALGVLEGAAVTDPAAYSVVVPAGARAGEASDFAQNVVTMVPGRAIDAESVTYAGEEPGAVLPAFAPNGNHPMPFLPTRAFTPDNDRGFVAKQLFSVTEGDPPGDPSSLRVFIPNPDKWIERIGMDGLPEGIQRVEPGGTVETGGTVFAVPSSISPGGSAIPVDTQKMLNAGKPVPLGGATFGLAALSTPSASIAGQEANPLVGIDTATLLERDAARRMLKRAGVTDADDVEWLQGPTQVGPDIGYLVDSPTATLLGETADLTLERGVVSGEHGPWGVAVLVARATPDDHVIAAGVVRRPLGTATVDMPKMWPRPYLGRAAEFALGAISRLKPTDRY